MIITVNFSRGTLRLEHLRQLRASGIRDDVIQDRGYWSVGSRDQAGELGFQPYQCRVPALAFPIYDAHLAIVGHQIRPDVPRVKDGKPVKYESPNGSTPHLDIPPAVPRESMTNSSVDLVVTEGIKKADAAVSHGLFCVAVLGVWMFRVEDWEQIVLDGRSVYIAFDSDVTTKPDVQKALVELKAYLEDRCAVVKVIYLPPRVDGGKVGVDDYLLTHTTEEMFALAEDVVRETTSEEVDIKPGTTKVIEAAESVSQPTGPDSEAFYGLAGEVCDLIEPHVETDPVAVLVQFLAGYGCAAGLGPHVLVGAVRHGSHLFVALIGETSRSRKGTSWAPVEQLLTQADPSFKPRIVGGLGSGEALVHEVRDPIIGEDKTGKLIVLDEGAEDKRLLLQESELARLFVAANRDLSTLSQNLRLAFDGVPIRNRVKSNPANAETHHIALIGQSTPQELRRRLTEDSISNGLGNRIAYFMSSRPKVIPRPPPFQGADVDEMVAEISKRLRSAKTIDLVSWSTKAGKLWDEWYEAETQLEQHGSVGALTSRAEAHTLRFAETYALLDASNVLQPDHVWAAIALWSNARASVTYIFGQSSGNVIADKIYEELGFGRLTRLKITEIFNRNVPAKELQVALNRLEELGWARCFRERMPGQAGRPAEVWERTQPSGI